MAMAADASWSTAMAMATATATATVNEWSAQVVLAFHVADWHPRVTSHLSRQKESSSASRHNIAATWLVVTMSFL